MQISSVSSKGQVVIPKAVRDRLGIKPGMALQFEPDADGFRVSVHRQIKTPSDVQAGLGLARYKGPRISEEDIKNAALRAHSRRG